MPIEYRIQSILNYIIARKVYKKIIGIFQNQKNLIFDLFTSFWWPFYIQNCKFPKYFLLIFPACLFLNRQSFRIPRNFDNFCKNFLTMSNCRNFCWLFWGHFEVLFEHETAIDFRKFYSFKCLFAGNGFHSSNLRNLSKFQKSGVKQFEKY